QRRTFVVDGRFEDSVRGVADPLPLGPRKLVALPRRMDAGEVQNLGRIQVADAGNGALVQQRNLYNPAALTEPFAKLLTADRECIGAQLVRPKNAFNFRG